MLLMNRLFHFWGRKGICKYHRKVVCEKIYRDDLIWLKSILQVSYSWYQDAPLHHLPVYQISKHLDYLFPLYGNFNTFTKRKQMKKQSQFLETHISKTSGAIYLKFEMWSTDGGGHLHSKNCPVSYKQHEVTYAQKSHYCFSC